MKKKNKYLLGMILSIIMSIFGGWLFMYALPCNRINTVLLCMYSFTTAAVAMMFYEQHIIEKKYEKHENK
jgi:heme/copper-type cytochrome/quinol oxidase subunit 4